MPAPNPIPSSDQHGLLKECISAVGMIGVLLFVVYSVYCLTESSLFSSLKADGPVVRQEAPKTLAGHLWFWGGLVATALFSYITFFIICPPVYNLPAEELSPLDVYKRQHQLPVHRRAADLFHPDGPLRPAGHAQSAL